MLLHLVLMLDQNRMSLGVFLSVPAPTSVRLNCCINPFNDTMHDHNVPRKKSTMTTLGPMFVVLI